MAWFRVDDTLPMNPKALSCSLEALGLWTLAGAWSCQQLTDGAIPKQMLQAFRSNASTAAELVDAGLWIETPNGYQFHDWADYQMTSTEVAERRKKRAEAGRKGGIKSGQTRRSKREASASAKTKQTGSKHEPHPIPYITDSNESVNTKEKKPKSTRATQIPSDWEPTDAHANLAMEHGINLGREADKFRDWAGAKGATYKNWNLAFNNWLRNAADWQPKDTGRTVRPVPSFNPQPLSQWQAVSNGQPAF